MRVMRDVAEALGIFISVLLMGSAVAWPARAVLGLPAWAAGLLTQLVFLGASLAIMRFLKRGWGEFGFKLSTSGLIHVSLLSIAIAVSLICITSALPEGGQGPSELVENPLALAISLLLVAPICEEVFFRGLLQGYLALKGYDRLSIVLPAVLFSAVHAIPFSSAGPALLSAVLAGALALGLIAGYFRAAKGSIAHAVLAHFWFNLPGLIAMML